MSESNLNNQSKKLFQIPLDSLDPVTYTMMIQILEPGTGDYTKEKYERPEMTMDEIKAELNAMRELKKNDC